MPWTRCADPAAATHRRDLAALRYRASNEDAREDPGSLPLAKARRDLPRPNTKLDPGIAAKLEAMAELYERGGRSADFASYIAKIRKDYGRRPSLMKALQARGL